MRQRCGLPAAFVLLLSCGGQTLEPQEGRGDAPQAGPLPKSCQAPEVKLVRPPVGSSDDPDLMSLEFRCEDAEGWDCRSFDMCRETVATKIRYRYSAGGTSWEGGWEAEDERAEAAAKMLGVRHNFASCQEGFGAGWDRGVGRCQFGAYAFADHVVDDLRARGLVAAAAGTLALEEVSFKFPNGRTLSLSEAAFPKLAKGFSEDIAARVRPMAALAKACMGQSPAQVLEACTDPREVAFRSNPGNVRALHDLTDRLCSDRFQACERSTTCDAEGFEHGRVDDYLASCWSQTFRQICVRKDADDAAWASAEADRCANPSQENDCARLAEYVHAFDHQFYLECDALKPFQGFHWEQAQAALVQGVPKCETLMVARVTAKCASPTAYDSCDELDELRHVMRADPRSAAWDALAKSAEPRVDDLTWVAVGQGARCRAPSTSEDCNTLLVYLRRHPRGRHAGAARAIVAGSAGRIGQLEVMEAAAVEARRMERTKWLSVCQAQCETTCSAWTDRSECLSRCGSACEDKIR